VTIKTGDKVVLYCDGSRVEAEVRLASPNGKSAIFTFEAILAGHVGMMPAIMHNNTEGVSLVGGLPIVVVRQETADA
jgi:hypothetical protein